MDFPTTSGAYQTSKESGYSDAFVSQVSLTTTVVNDESTITFCDDKKGSINVNECPFAKESQTQGPGGDPINTRTGGLDYPVTDLIIQTVVADLSFIRTYSSLATDLYTDVLGYGWTHNHDTRLIFSDDPGGREGVVLFKAHSANQYEIVDNGDFTYSASPGVGVTLTRNVGPPVTFTLTSEMQNSYTFDEEGRLLTWADPQGHTWTYTYDASERLDLITDDTSGRFLDIAYDTASRIETVTDSSGRWVAFTYDAGELIIVRDVSGENWTYEYDAEHRLTYVRDPDSVAVVHTEYDAEGRAKK